LLDYRLNSHLLNLSDVCWSINPPHMFAMFIWQRSCSGEDLPMDLALGRLRTFSHGSAVSAIVALLFAAGCSGAASRSSEFSTAAPPPVPVPTTASPAKPQAKSPVDKPLAESSLDQLRQGAVTATPAESPLQDIYFAFDSYDLQASARDALKANVDWLKSNPAPRVEIEGHSDERGTTEYNLALSARRAQMAKDYMVTLGVAPERLSTIAYGKELPVCQDHSEECWQKNRRVHFVAKSTPTN
jgi:peptidoglycan-associated lipoprotein